MQSSSDFSVPPEEPDEPDDPEDQPDLSDDPPSVAKEEETLISDSGSGSIKMIHHHS